MEIRKGDIQDIPQLVVLLKAALGDQLMPKSEAFWTWKHMDNPFGQSLILVASEGDQIIGVRAFMRWNWMIHGQSYRALRAVDTAVLPTYQGQGIFSKLTAQLIAELGEENIDFIFNTPNQQSLPGYLKLGWNKVGKLSVGVKPFLSLKGKVEPMESTWKALEKLDFSLMLIPEFWQTNLSYHYLYWRYRDCPIASYSCLSDGQSYFCIYRVKKLKGLRELRIVELGMSSNSTKALTLVPVLKHAAQCENVQVITTSKYHAQILENQGFGKFWTVKGPLLTVRKLDKKLSAKVDDLNAWSGGLGALELF